MEKLKDSPGATGAVALGSSPGPRSGDGGAVLNPTDTFVRRHLGANEEEIRQMLAAIGAGSLAELVRETVPESIFREAPLALAGLPADRELGEQELLAALRGVAGRNQVFRSFLGMGYHDCITPPVIQRNILENPGWYTQYTPYQAEIAQGRLEALLNFQTMVADLTGLPIANASLLDEGTAAAEAMNMCHTLKRRGKRNVFFVADDCHPQTIEVVQTRAGASASRSASAIRRRSISPGEDLFGVLLQYPATDGRVVDYAPLAERAHAAGALVVVAADLLALTLLRAPGEFGADIAVGSAQRFGVPMGFGGPHAAFLATRDEYKRQMPGRIIGVSQRPPRQARAAHGAADPRAAHPPREGDQQHLHRPGAARRHGRHVRRLPRARGPEGDRPPGARPGGGARRGAAPARLRRRARALLRHPARGHRRALRRRPRGRRRSAAGSTCASSGSGRSASRSTRRPPPPTSRSCWRSSARSAGPGSPPSALAAGAEPRLPGAARPRSRRS